MKNNKEKCAGLVLLVFSTAFSFACGDDNRNLLLIGMLIFVFPVLLLFQCPSFHKREFFLYLLTGYMLLSGIINPEYFRKETVLYTILFVTTFVYYLRLVFSGSMELLYYRKLLTWLIAAYCIVLLIQQTCYILGLPIFNLISSIVEEFKFNSLAPEPSQSSRILALLMYSFITIKEIQSRHSYNILMSWSEDKWTWFFFIYTMVTMRSGTAFVLLFFLAFKLLRWRNFLIVLLLTISAGWFAYSRNYIPLVRAVHFVTAFVTFDESSLVAADHSASLRVLPTLIYLKKIDVTSLQYWFGFGVDYNVKFYSGLIPGIKEGLALGNISSSFLIDYGLLAGVFLLMAIFTLCIRKYNWFDIGILAFIAISLSLNSQIFWLFLMLLATNKYFYRCSGLKNELLHNY